MKTFKTVLYTIAAVLWIIVALVYMSDPQDQSVKTAETQAVVNVAPAPEEPPVVATPSMSLSARMLAEQAPEEPTVVDTPAIKEEAYQYQWRDEIRKESSMCDSKKHIDDYMNFKRQGAEDVRAFYRENGWCKLSKPGQKIKVLSGDWDKAEVRDLADGKIWWVNGPAVMK